MRCPSCGSRIRRDLARCPSCGAQLDSATASFGGAARDVRTAWGLAVQETASAPKGARRTSRYLVFAIVGLALVALTLVAVLALQRTTEVRAGVAIDAEAFPDEVFRNVVAGYDANGDGHLSTGEALAATSLDVSGLGISDLTGIGSLTGLTSLRASDNDLVAVDLSGNARLTSVDLSGNAISSLDVSGCTGLLSLDISDNGMTALDVSGCTGLVELVCTGNAIARLDLAQATSLSVLVCDEGQDATIPLSQGFFPDDGVRAAVAALDADADGALSNREQESATSLSIESPATEDLTGLSWLTSLTTLDISGTRVSALDAAKLPKSLTTLVACDCDIATADLSGMERLISLDLSGNPLRSIRLEGLAGLTTLDLSDCALTGTLSVAGAPALVWLDVSGNPGLAALDATAAPALAGSEAIAADEGCAVSVASTELLEPQGGETSEPVSDETANTVS